MKPTCFLIRPEEGRGTILYLEDVSTVECLTCLPAGDPVSIIEFGATSPRDRWLDVGVLSETECVSDLLTALQTRPEMSLVNFVADVGAVRLSTHDDGEAELTFRSPLEAVAFLNICLAPSLADEVIPRLLNSPGRYVANVRGSWKSFETFDDYLINQSSDHTFS